MGERNIAESRHSGKMARGAGKIPLNNENLTCVQKNKMLPF